MTSKEIYDRIITILGYIALLSVAGYFMFSSVYWYGYHTRDKEYKAEYNQLKLEWYEKTRPLNIPKGK